MPELPLEPKRWVLPLLAGVTLLGMGGIGMVLIVLVQERSIVPVLHADRSIAVLLGAGTLAGAVMSMGGWFIIRRPWLRPVLDRYASIIGPLAPSLWQQVMVSACAGVGEELLFRGALQHWLGIPLTALLFVALHGYLDPRDRPVMAYGLYLSAWMLGFGWFALHHGLLAPMVAHAVFDLFIMSRLVARYQATAAGST